MTNENLLRNPGFNAPQMTQGLFYQDFPPRVQQFWEFASNFTYVPLIHLAPKGPDPQQMLFIDRNNIQANQPIPPDLYARGRVLIYIGYLVAFTLTYFPNPLFGLHSRTTFIQAEPQFLNLRIRSMGIQLPLHVVMPADLRNGFMIYNLSIVQMTPQEQINFANTQQFRKRDKMRKKQEHYSKRQRRRRGENSDNQQTESKKRKQPSQ